ncbi:hypothetical protein P7C70_g6338, partial [Phenoliferia sp. Uapishka_3]
MSKHRPPSRNEQHVLALSCIPCFKYGKPHPLLTRHGSLRLRIRDPPLSSASAIRLSPCAGTAEDNFHSITIPDSATTYTAGPKNWVVWDPKVAASVIEKNATQAVEAVLGWVTENLYSDNLVDCQPTPTAHLSTTPPPLSSVFVNSSSTSTSTSDSNKTPVRLRPVLGNANGTTPTSTPAAGLATPFQQVSNVSQARRRREVKRPRLEDKENTGSYGSEQCDECGAAIKFDERGRSLLSRHQNGHKRSRSNSAHFPTPPPLLPRVPSTFVNSPTPFGVNSNNSTAYSTPPLLPPPLASPSTRIQGPTPLTGSSVQQILSDPICRRQLLASFIRCPGYLVPRPYTKSAGVLFAPQLLSKATLPWVRASFVGEEMYLESKSCADFVFRSDDGTAIPCEECRKLENDAKVIALRNHAIRTSQVGVHHQHLSFSQVEELYKGILNDASVLRRKVTLILLKMRCPMLISSSKVAKRDIRIRSLLQQQQLHQELLLLMETSDFPRIPALLRRASRRNESPAKIMATLQLVLDGSLRLRSFSEKEKILAMFHNHLGGERDGQIAYKAHFLHSPRQTRRIWGKRHLRHSTGYATASDMRHNLDLSFGFFGAGEALDVEGDEVESDGEDEPEGRDEKRPASVEYPKGRVWTWMTDGVHVGGTAVWDPDTNRLEGPSRESRGTTSADINTYDDLLHAYESLKDGSLAFATEVAVSALAPYSVTDYHPRIVSASPTNPTYLSPATDPVARQAERALRDSNLAADVEQQIRVSDEFLAKHGLGVVVSLSADAAADQAELSRPLLLEGARRICQQCGPLGKKLSSDDRHGWKTLGSTKRRALGINVFGVVLTPAVQVAQCRRAYPELTSFQISLLFWSGRGNMDVPAVTDLMRKEGEAVHRRRAKLISDPDDFRSPIQERTDAASDLMGHISELLLAPYYATSSTTLSNLLIGLSTAQHLLFYCYRAKQSAFIPGTVYISLCSSIDATFTAVAQAIALGDPNYKFPINRSGSQGLESVFGNLRTQHGSQTTFNILELTDRLSKSADLEDGYSKYPDLRLPRDRRNLSGSVDLVSPRDTPDVDISISNLSGTLGELYNQGEQEAIKIIVDLRLASLADLESVPAHFDCLSPFGVRLGTSDSPLEGAEDEEDPSNQPFDNLSQPPEPPRPHSFPTVFEGTQILRTEPRSASTEPTPDPTSPHFPTSSPPPQSHLSAPSTSSTFDFNANLSQIAKLEAHLLQTSLEVAVRHPPKSPSRPNRFFPPCAVGDDVYKARGVKVFINEGHERQSQDREKRVQHTNRYRARNLSEGGVARAFDRDDAVIDAALEADHLIAFIIWTGASAALAIARVVDIQVKKGEFEPQATQQQLDSPETSIRYQLLTLHPTPLVLPESPPLELNLPLHWDWSLLYETFKRIDNKFLVDARIVILLGDGREFFINNQDLTSATYRFPERRLKDLLFDATERLGSRLSLLPKLAGSPTFPY